MIPGPSVADSQLSKSPIATLIERNDLSSQDLSTMNYESQTTALTSTTTDLPSWTWWSPGSFDKSENKYETGDNGESVENDDGAEERLWEPGDNKINEAPDNNDIGETDYSVSNRDNREGNTDIGDPEDDWDNLLDTFESSTDIHEDQGDIHDSIGNDKESLRDKYLELMTHNTKLVDILKKTLEMQADMFRRLIKYIFPWLALQNRNTIR